ncbi:MAG: mechanosensitive ion channel family protein [Planctomycetota bacterium]|jgi:small-conductance mechanosensitive channel
MLALLQNWEKLTWLCGICVLLGLAGHFFVFHFLRNLAKRSKGVLDDSTVKHCYRPLQWTVILLVIHLLLPVLTPPSRFYGAARHVTRLVLIGLVAWLAIKAVLVLEDWVVGRFEVDTTDNLRARKIHTQLRVMKRIAILLVAILALGTMLMTFDQVRQLGTTILASAGIIGIVVGMAAQRTIGSFIAGLQIALTQPIRVDDVVIVENEWGRIEEITLTYVVVKIWDLRRLVVPITYFIEKPFQNWTRVTADILGTVYLYVDYTVPVESVREELQRILKDSELWDSKVCVLQVTNTSERAVELRALMSAKDASTAWSLRCEVREKLITFIKKDYPQSLPKLRAEFYPLKGDEGQARE